MGLSRTLGKDESSPVLVFGFTFIVWQQFLERAQRAGWTARFPPGSILVHGGWKRLSDRHVSNAVFKEALGKTFGITRVHNYYGMVEQVGSVSFECEAGIFTPHHLRT